jgi:hypothetical protein
MRLLRSAAGGGRRSFFRGDRSRQLTIRPGRRTAAAPFAAVALTQMPLKQVLVALKGLLLL